MTNVEKFEAMLREMYGEEYEEDIEIFIDDIQCITNHMEMDDLFIRWASVLIQARDMRRLGLV